MGLVGWPQLVLMLGCVLSGVTASLLATGKLHPGFLLAVDVSHILCMYGHHGHSRDPVRQQALAATAVMHITNHFVEAGAGQVVWCFDTIQDKQKNIDRDRAGVMRDTDLAAGLAWLVAIR
jgi:hypothetical protein